MRIYYPILIISGFFCTSFYFSKNESIYIDGLLTNNHNKKPIAFAHVYNESSRLGTITDSLGFFTLPSKPGDTVIFVALGYLGKHCILRNKDFDSIFKISLIQRTYEIEEVIVEIPRTYKDFKKAILEHDINKHKPLKDLPQHNNFITPILLDTNIISSPGFIIMHPISALYYNYSKEEKSKRKAWYLKEQELKQNRVDQKFNRRIVYEITGLEDENLTQFIGFCNFSFKYLFEASAYEIILAIEEKYRAYARYISKEKEDTIP